ncbi:MAG: choice-of-anchor D domain-containing protein [Bacteroidales bacterium]|nr:choice-of-anchor D domain-containing protein [Bacteroidales bacterium]
MKKTFTLSTILLLWCLMALGQTTVTIGSGTTTDYTIPVGAYYNYSYNQQIVLQSEIATAGSITKIKFYMVGGVDLSNSNNWTIYMGHTTKTGFASTTDWEAYSSLTQVYYGTIASTPSAGWYEITLSVPFNYNNTDNLLVAVDENNPAYGSVTHYARVWSPSTIYYRSLQYASSTNPDPSAPPTAVLRSKKMNQMQLVFETATAVPNCATAVSPADLATDVSLSASLNWASGGGVPTGFKLYFGTDNPPTNLVNGTDLGQAITYDPTPDMNYGTTYYWEIVPYNAFGDAMGCPVWSFTTPDDPAITTFPYTESFDGTTFPPTNWITEKVFGLGNPGTWDRQTSGTRPTCQPHSGAAMSRYNCYNLTNPTFGMLVTPPIQFPSDDFRVRFWMYRNNSSWADFLRVYYNTNNTITGATLLGSIYNSNLFAPVVASAGWYEYTFDMPTGAAGTGRYIIFEGSSAAGYNIFIDDVTIELIPVPAISVSPASNNYGTLFSGNTSSDQLFTIENSGTGTLTLETGSITLTGADADQFTITDNNTYPINLTAGQTATVSVAFAPTTAGSKTANLQLVHNAAGSPTSVALSGLALPEGSLYETFQGTWKPACWSADPSTWVQNITAGYNSTKCAFYYSIENIPEDVKLITPKVVVANGDQISYFAKTLAGTEQKIQIKYSADKINWTNIGSEASLTTSFAQYSTDLSSLDGQTVYLALSASSINPYVLFYVDDVTGPQIAEPSQATIGAPADGATNVDLTTNLTWGNNGQGNDPTGYKLYFGTDNPPTNLANGTNLGLVTSYDPPTDLAYNTTYYWKIVPFNDISEATGSSVWSFTTLPASATTWTGSASTDWNTAANWSNGVPGANTEVTIPGNTSTFPTLTTAASVKQLILQNNGSFIGAEYLTTTLPSLVQRDLTANAFHFIASPVAPTTIGSILPNNQSGVYVRGYDEPIGNWTNLMAEDNTTTGMGYSITMNAPQTALFSGTLNTDPLNLTLSRQGATGGDSYVGWNLVGNPYPSALDWSAVVAANLGANFEGAAYIYSGSQYIATNGLNGGIADGLIPVGNGFFVKATANGASFNIPLAARAHSNHSIYKTTLPNNLTVAVSGNQFNDKTFIRLHNQATEGFDARWDARKLDGDEHAPQLYTLAGDFQLSINELPEKSETNIPLAVRCGSDGEFTLSFTGLESFPTNSSITLEDKLLGTTQAVDNNTSYPFTYATTHDANRFVIHLAMATSVNEINDLNTRVFYANHLLEIENNSGMKGLMTLYDMAGRPVLVQNIAEGHNQAQINQAKGIYLVRIEYATGAACFKINLMQ